MFPHRGSGCKISPQRVNYDPERDHDYSNEKPSMVEVEPEHFVYCSPSELAAYREQLKG